MNHHDLGPHIRFNAEIESTRFDEARSQWLLHTTSGEDHWAHVLVFACGQLNRPTYPKIAGLSELEAVQFHSARWNHDYDLSGKTVGYTSAKEVMAALDA